MIRVVVAEDQGLVLGALAALLDLEVDIDVIGRARNGDEALALCEAHRPEVLVTDIEMPGRSGLDVAQALQAQGSSTRVVVVTTFGRPGYLRRALDHGVRAYLLKDQPSEQLVDAVRKVAAGGKVVASELAEAAWGTPDPLTERQRAVLRLAELGRSNKDIAGALNLSLGTVRNYLSEAAQKLGAENRVEAARIARANGWL